MYTRIAGNAQAVVRWLDGQQVPVTDPIYVAWLARGFTPCDPLPTLPPAGVLTAPLGLLVNALMAKGALKLTDLLS